MTETIENCQLEWDKARGVLYVHNKDTGSTVLRVCGLSRDKRIGKLLPIGQIDITNPERVSYPYDN